MEVKNENFAAYIDTFTSNTYVMVILTDPTIPSATALYNIRHARKQFDQMENAVK
jgi:Ras-related GTP-binding protein A/B